jgi:glycosyltransferase involved in cell wall biosynthesis
VNEACCAGCAVIVSDEVGCHPDLVRSGENGLVFPAGNLSALGDAISFALEDDDRLRVWGAASRRIVSAYSFAAATRGLQTALDCTIDGATK